MRRIPRYPSPEVLRRAAAIMETSTLSFETAYAIAYADITRERLLESKETR